MSTNEEVLEDFPMEIVADDKQPMSIDKAVEELEVKMEQYKIALERFTELQTRYQEIKRLGGVDKSTAIALENFQEGLISKRVNLNSFTTGLSKTNYELTLEQLEVAMESEGGVVAVIFGIIVAIIVFIINLLGFAAGSAGSSDKIYFKYEKLASMDIYRSGRSVMIDSVFTDSQFNSYREKMMTYIEKHYSEEFATLRTADELKSAKTRQAFEHALGHFLNDAFNSKLYKGLTQVVDLTTINHISVSDLPKDLYAMFTQIMYRFPFMLTSIKAIEADLKEVIEATLKEKDKFITGSTIAQHTPQQIAKIFSDFLAITNNRAKHIRHTADSLVSIAKAGYGGSGGGKITIQEVLKALEVDQMLKTPVKYDSNRGKRTPPDNYFSNFKVYKKRPSNILDLEKEKDVFYALKEAFEKKVEEGYQGKALVGDEGPRILALRLTQEYFIKDVKQIFGDIAAGMKFAIQVDKAYSDFIRNFDVSFKRDCETFIHHYQYLAAEAGNDTLRNNYVKKKKELTELRQELVG